MIIPSIVMAYFHFFADMKSNDWSVYAGFFFGSCLYFGLSIINSNFLKHNSDWFRIFSHELTHVVTGLFFLQRIQRFSVTKGEGGFVEYHGSGNFVITLSPYFFPLYSILLLIIRLLVTSNILFFIDILIGITLMFHLVCFLKQFSIRQPDIQRNGIIFSFLFVLVMNLLFIAMLLVVIRNGFTGYASFLHVASIKFVDLIMVSFKGIANLIMR